MNLSQKLNTRFKLQEDTSGVTSDLDKLWNLANSATRFDSKKQFENFLTEGAMFNINSLCSAAISIPAGKYLVYGRNDDNVVLMRAETPELYKADPDTYEISQKNLVNSWNKIERLLN